MFVCLWMVIYLLLLFVNVIPESRIYTFAVRLCSISPISYYFSRQTAALTLMSKPKSEAHPRQALASFYASCHKSLSLFSAPSYFSLYFYVLYISFFFTHPFIHASLNNSHHEDPWFTVPVRLSTSRSRVQAGKAALEKMHL